MHSIKGVGANLARDVETNFYAKIKSQPSVFALIIAQIKSKSSVFAQISAQIKSQPSVFNLISAPGLPYSL